MRGNSPVRFGKGPTEKDPNHGHLAGGLLHSAGYSSSSLALTCSGDHFCSKPPFTASCNRVEATSFRSFGRVVNDS
jgi:hypothetical protein